MEDVDMLYIMVGKRVRQLRLRRNLTQEQLAERAGISTSFLEHLADGWSEGNRTDRFTVCKAASV